MLYFRLMYPGPGVQGTPADQTFFAFKDGQKLSHPGSRRVMGGLYSGLGPSWVRIEPSRARLKSLLGRPGTSWGHPEASWESTGGHV